MSDIRLAIPLRRYRRIESDACQAVAMECEASGINVDCGTVAWIWQEVESRVRREVFEAEARREFRYFFQPRGKNQVGQ